MSENVDFILEKARALTPGEKAELLERLGELIGDSDSNLDPEWAAEIEDRLDAFDRGELEVIDIAEVTYKRRS
jgi:Putative addiction module component